MAASNYEKGRLTQARYLGGGWMKIVRKWFSGKKCDLSNLDDVVRKGHQLEVAGFFAVFSPLRTITRLHASGPIKKRRNGGNLDEG